MYVVAFKRKKKQAKLTCGNDGNRQLEDSTREPLKMFHFFLVTVIYKYALAYIQGTH